MQSEQTSGGANETKCSSNVIWVRIEGLKFKIDILTRFYKNTEAVMGQMRRNRSQETTVV